MEELNTDAEVAAYRAEKMQELWPDEPVHVETVNQEQPVTTDPAVEEEQNNDPLSGVDPALRDLISGISGRLDKLDAIDRRLKPLEGRVGQLQQQMREATEIVQRQAETPTKAQMAEATKDSEAMELLKEDFPEWFAAFESQRTELASLREGLSALKNPNADLEQIKREYEVKLISVRHPGWKDVVASTEYAGWLATQDEETRRLAAESTDALECIAILDRYTKEKPQQSAAEIAQARADRLKASTARPQGRQAVNKQKSEDDMTDAELREHLAKKYWST